MYGYGTPIYAASFGWLIKVNGYKAVNASHSTRTHGVECLTEYKLKGEKLYRQGQTSKCVGLLGKCAVLAGNCAGEKWFARAVVGKIPQKRDFLRRLLFIF